VLGYSVTCNHIHLLAQDPGGHNVIARGMQLLQGSMAQEFNKRNGRINAFWGDRYHATAVEPGPHLLRCLAYIDLNMVRAGVVAQPGDWRECGYHELHDYRVRDGIVDKPRLAALLKCPDQDSLAELHEQAIAGGLQQDALRRDERWSESLAIGSESFVNAFAVALGDRLGDRTVSDAGDQGAWVVREPSPAAYWDELTAFLAGDNTHSIDEVDI